MTIEQDCRWTNCGERPLVDCLFNLFVATLWIRGPTLPSRTPGRGLQRRRKGPNMHTHTHTHALHTHKRTYTHSLNKHIMQACMHTHTHTHIYTHLQCGICGGQSRTGTDSSPITCRPNSAFACQFNSTKAL
jgi:hypothetical protein